MDLVHIYKKIVTDTSMSWVLFKYGTCVLLFAPQENIKEQAVSILREHGSVVAGTPSGDFEVTKIPEINGWVITGDYPGIMIYVSSDEGKNKSDIEIGLAARMKREADARSLEIVHVEDKRKNM